MINDGRRLPLNPETHDMKHPLLLTPTLLFLLLLVIQTIATAQTNLSTCEQIKNNDNFLALADKRAELLDESGDLKTEISELEKQLPEAVPVAEFEAQKRKFEELQAKAQRTPLEEQTMQNLEGKLKLLKTDESLNAEIAKKKELLGKDKDLIGCIQETIPRLTTPDQQFKGYMSVGFAALIAIVIGGFFFLASRDEVMRRAIFSGETGIQFLTLFSVVIAIILFGIINILEGKELAALLGGLSGYILGRTTQRTGAAPSPPSSPEKVAALQKFVRDLNAINLTPPSANLSPTAKAQQITAEPKDINGAVIKDDDKFFVPVWESSDPNVATVDQSGLVSRVGAGDAQITAMFANIRSNPCAVNCT
jgi:hypothetical protein